MKFRKHNSKHEPEVFSDSLVDIMFILLMFFLITSTLANPNVKRVNTPKGKKDTKMKQNVMVSITADHKVFIGQKEVGLNNMDSLLKFEIKKTGIDTPSVIIRCDTLAYFGEAYKIMEIAKRSGAKVGINVKGN